ncbi:MAG: Bug family tripartite tricarboxylate transporter substrate binding protein, partial [Xanthobacteraceae bacterium]
MSLRPMVRHAMTVLAILAVLLSGRPSGAETYPASKITIVVAFAPGGFADTMARFIAEGLRERLRQTIVVENRAGAGGNIAASFVAHATPDGYTLLATTTALAINETLTANKQFSANDLKTVAIVTSNPEALATSPSNPADSLSAFIKAMNGKVINFGSAGVGTGSHIEAEYFFKILAKVPAQHIPFQGG